MAQIARCLQQSSDFVAAQNQRQLPLAPRTRNAFDSDLPAQGMGIEEAQCADHQHVGGCRHFLFSGQEQLISANVLGTELIGWFPEVSRELSDGVQVEPDRGRRIVADLEGFQHPLSKWGHNKTPFVVTTSQIQPLWDRAFPAPLRSYFTPSAESRLAHLPAEGFVQWWTSGQLRDQVDTDVFRRLTRLSQPRFRPDYRTKGISQYRRGILMTY